MMRERIKKEITNEEKMAFPLSFGRKELQLVGLPERCIAYELLKTPLFFSAFGSHIYVNERFVRSHRQDIAVHRSELRHRAILVGKLMM
jgi:hypothetical protein